MNAAGKSVGAGAVQAAGTDGVATAALRARNRGLERVVAAERQAKDKAEREVRVQGSKRQGIRERPRMNNRPECETVKCVRVYGVGLA